MSDRRGRKRQKAQAAKLVRELNAAAESVQDGERMGLVDASLLPDAAALSKPMVFMTSFAGPVRIDPPGIRPPGGPAGPPVPNQLYTQFSQAVMQLLNLCEAGVHVVRKERRDPSRVVMARGWEVEFRERYSEIMRMTHDLYGSIQTTADSLKGCMTVAGSIRRIVVSAIDRDDNRDDDDFDDV